MTRRTIVRHVDDLEQAQRDALTGPNTRWLAPAQQSGPPAELLEPLRPAAPLATVEPMPGAFSNQGAAEEYATPVSRAKGQVVRLLPFSVVWLLLTGGLVWLLALDWPWLLLGFSFLTAVTYWRLNRDEFEYSRNGLERHRIDRATALQSKAMDQQHELRKAALETYLEIARAQYLGVTDDDA